MSRAQFEQLRGPQGLLFVGSVSEILDKLLHLGGFFGNTRFSVQLILGDIPHAQVMCAIQLYWHVGGPGRAGGAERGSAH